ncbi:MAG: hypothetical protein NVS4B8_30720 [Herpetosiphon sp.]
MKTPLLQTELCYRGSMASALLLRVQSLVGGDSTVPVATFLDNDLRAWQAA